MISIRALERPVESTFGGMFRSIRRSSAFVELALRSLVRARELRDPIAAAIALSEICKALVDRHGVHVHCEGSIPQIPAVLASNHQSYLDPLVLIAIVPSLPIAKHEIASWPLVGAVLRAFGVLFVDRGSPPSGAAVIRAATRKLQAGVSVLGFPEGSTTEGTELLPFRPGLFSLARRAATPLVPIGINYSTSGVSWTGDASFIPHYLRLSAKPRIDARVAFGQAIDPRDFESAAALSETARDRIALLSRAEGSRS